jgi:glycosyltransferase involved in cell wall biosynthesis
MKVYGAGGVFVTRRLHDLAPAEVPARHRSIVRVIRQSAAGPRQSVAKARGAFVVVVVGHLRAIKDPLRTAMASRLLAASSRVRVIQAGAALEPAFARAAQAEQRSNPRYRWLGEVTAARAVGLIARAHLFVLTSYSEGGANVLGEAAMCGTPVVASAITATKAALGETYPGMFPAGDEHALAAAISRAETDAKWLAGLARRVRGRRRLFDERGELGAWRKLLAELGGPRR